MFVASRAARRSLDQRLHPLLWRRKDALGQVGVQGRVIGAFRDGEISGEAAGLDDHDHVLEAGLPPADLPAADLGALAAQALRELALREPCLESRLADDLRRRPERFQRDRRRAASPIPRRVPSNTT